MSFCPRCGAPTTPSMSFCTACGETLAPAVYPQGQPAQPPSPAVAPTGALPAAAPAAPRVRGQTQEPALVVLLTIVTLGIYQYVYWWRVSKEVDAFRGTPGHAHKPIRIATFLGIGVFVLAMIMVFSLIGSMVANVEALESETITDEQAFAMMGPFFVFFPILMIAGIAAFILLLVGEWRVWSTIENEERARNHPKPLSPGIQLLFMIIPYVNIVTMFVALYKTQDRLNGLWAQNA